MVSPRERSRPARRRIAGERSRPAAPPAPPDAPETPTRLEPAHPPPAGTEHAPSSEDVGPAPGTAPVEEQAPEEPPQAEAAAVPAEGSRPEAPPEERAGVGGPPTWVLAVLAVLLAVALVADGFVFWQQQRDQEAAERALHSAVTVAPSVAERAAEAVLSYRYNTFDKDVAEAGRFLSARYRPDYVASIRDVVRKPAQEVGAVVRAQVLASGVVEASGERADVLLFVNQTTTSAADTQSQTALNRVVFTMVPRDGAWKVDEIRAF